MITLSQGGTTLELSDRLLWVDEFEWGKVATANRWGTDGALFVHVGVRKAGRPITLDGRESQAWITRQLCEQLYAWAALPGATFSLFVRGQARDVKFNHGEGQGFTASPIWKLLDGEHTSEVLYRPYFKFMEV